MSRPPRASPAHGTLLSHASTEWSLFPPRVYGPTCAGRPSLSPRPASPWRPLPRHPIAVSSSRPNPTPVLSPPFHLRVCARRNASRFSVPLKLLELAEVPRGLESGLQSPKAYCYFRHRTRNGSENPKCQQRRGTCRSSPSPRAAGPLAAPLDLLDAPLVKKFYRF